MKITPPQHMTPGPWTDTLASNGFFFIHGPIDGSSCREQVCRVDGTGEEETERANAKAIAAMPQLLAALEFYANPDNWKEKETGIGMAPSDADCDGGSEARQALTAAGYTITP